MRYKLKRKCEYCKDVFFTNNPDQYYCCPKCKKKDYEQIFPSRKPKSKSELDAKIAEAKRQNKSYGRYVAEIDGMIPTAEDIMKDYFLYLYKLQYID